MIELFSKGPREFIKLWAIKREPILNKLSAIRSNLRPWWKRAVTLIQWYTFGDIFFLMIENVSNVVCLQIKTFCAYFIASEYKKDGRCRFKLSRQLKEAPGYYSMLMKKRSPYVREFSHGWIKSMRYEDGLIFCWTGLNWQSDEIVGERIGRYVGVQQRAQSRPVFHLATTPQFERRPPGGHQVVRPDQRLFDIRNRTWIVVGLLLIRTRSSPYQTLFQKNSLNWVSFDVLNVSSNLY